MAPTMLLLSLLVFVMMRVVPGDIAIMLMGEEVGATNVDFRVSIETLRERLGLNRPLYIQYLSWIWDTVRGDLGKSLVTGVPITTEIATRLPITLELAILAKLISLVLGIPIGIISAVKQNSWMDYLLRLLSILFLTAPSFWLGLMFIFAAAIWFNWIPPLGYNPLWENPGANIAQLLAPALILGLSGLATMARMTRSTMLEVMREDYIRTARAKGLREPVVIYRHALKNALIPVVTLAGLSFATLLGGTVILESIFGIPGMGQYLINAITIKDFPVVQGIIMVFAVILMMVNLVVDLLYGWLDPRISYS